ETGPAVRAGAGGHGRVDRPVVAGGAPSQAGGGGGAPGEPGVERSVPAGRQAAGGRGAVASAGVPGLATADYLDIKRYAGSMRDEVDGLVEAWRTGRPDLDVEPLQVLSRVSRLARHLDRARRSVFAEHDLE